MPVHNPPPPLWTKKPRYMDRKNPGHLVTTPPNTPPPPFVTTPPKKNPGVDENPTHGEVHGGGGFLICGLFFCTVP